MVLQRYPSCLAIPAAVCLPCLGCRVATGLEYLSGFLRQNPCYGSGSDNLASRYGRRAFWSALRCKRAFSGFESYESA